MQEYVNEEAQNLIDSGQIRIEDIGNNKESYLPLMENICSKMINALRRRSVTGIYVAFNTEDLDKRSQNDFIPTLYIRDLDPDSLPPEKNTDLLMERSPVELVKFTGISTDKGWKSLMSVSAESTEKFIYPVFQKAFKDQGSLRAADYGHWTTENYTLDGDDRSAIAYSIPLILDDGTVYGVLGVEMLTEYLNIQMPYEELQNQSAGTYMLAYTKSSLKDEEIVLENICGVSSKSSSMEQDLESEKLKLQKNFYGDYLLKLNGKKYYATLKPLQLYSRNAPFFDEQWVLIGTVEMGQLFSFSGHVIKVLSMTILLTLLVGILSSLIVSLSLARPVKKLSDEVEEAQKNNSTSLRFSDTGIRELDQFARAITQMNQDMLTISTKFLRIMEMASEYMTDEECREFRQRYLDIRSQLVLEITEQELLSKEALERKTSKGFLGAVALDDYGSGYNSEKSLLALSPKYIKVDMVIIRDIDTDIDKQQIVANIVKYAHQRGMYIVAEGVETAEELKKVLELEVDLLQGYYLSRPAATPGAINPDALKIIEENRKR